MNIYTRGGDNGETSLVGGKRVPKDSIRVEAYGTVDELNSVIGYVRAIHNQYHKGGDDCIKIEDELRNIQNNLLNIGSHLATPGDAKPSSMPYIESTDITRLEKLIDDMTKELKPLKTFIIPGGGIIGSAFHHARTVCRRAERRIISLSSEENVPPLIIKYINRLSDTLFTMARWEAHNHNEKEYYWEKN